MSTVGALDALDRLRDELRAAGGLLAGELLDDAPARPWNARSYAAEPDLPGGAAPKPSPGSLAAAGPRAALCTAEYEFLVEAIYEGYLLHYETPRLFRAGDPDMALLVGDRLYALGLERLVALGDIPAVVELADVISLCALAHARGHGELAGPIWSAGARAVGWGSTPAHRAAKALVMGGDHAAGPALDALNGSPGVS
ncbi:MAG TPA: hypothetical protein VHW26_03810 [Solirubrobacteraceae bacterium]|jgi:hypothetical protein|nr:hypothetical protein [Solirubrobacteraceae bacterium]